MNDSQIYIMVDAFREENRMPTREALHDFVLDIIGDGKTLRDEFAMAATSEDLKPFIKKFFVKGTKFDGSLTRIVDVEGETPTYEARYAFANAMLKAREYVE